MNISKEKRKEYREKWKIFKADLKPEELEWANKLIENSEFESKRAFTLCALKRLEDGTLKKEETDD